MCTQVQLQCTETFAVVGQVPPSQPVIVLATCHEPPDTFLPEVSHFFLGALPPPGIVSIAHPPPPEGLEEALRRCARCVSRRMYDRGDRSALRPALRHSLHAYCERAASAESTVCVEFGGGAFKSLVVSRACGAQGQNISS